MPMNLARVADLRLSLYRAVYVRVRWLVRQAGPLAPTLMALGRGIHRRVYTSRRVVAHNPQSVDGFRIWHDGHPASSNLSLFTGRYEQDTARLLTKLLRPGATVLDVGANLGYFSLVLARLVGEAGTVWAFEPAPHLLALLRRNVEGNGFQDRVRVVPEAATDAPGTARFHVNLTEHMRSSIYRRAAAYEPEEEGFECQEVEVPSTSLDAWAARHGWPTVDLCKLDVEGAETAVLRGMAELSRRNPRFKLVMEFNVRTLEAAGETTDDLLAALEACDLRHVYVVDNELLPLSVPDDVPELIEDMRRRVDLEGGYGHSANLLCSRVPVVF